MIGAWSLFGGVAAPAQNKSRPSGHLPAAPRVGLPTHYHVRLLSAAAIRGSSSPAQPQESSSIPSSPLPLPLTNKRLVAKGVAPAIRQAVHVIEEPLPVPGPGEVLVRVSFAGINGGCETFRVRGEFWFANNARAGPAGFKMGAEGSGVIAALGPTPAAAEGAPPGAAGAPAAASAGAGAALAVGQAVTFVGGAFSEFVVLPAASVFPVAGASAEAAALAISGLTAALSLEHSGKMQPTDTVFVTAAAGGTGHLAVQWAKLAGCHVIGTCGGARKAALLRELGCDRVIDHTVEDVGAVLSAEYPNGVDLVYEGVGGAMLTTAMAALAEGGRLLVIGYISEYPHARTGAAQEPAGSRGVGAPSQSISERLFWQGGTLECGGRRRLIGSQFAGREVVQATKRRLFDSHARGELRVVIDTTAEFSGVEALPDALEHMLSGKSFGKVVARVGARE